MHITVVSKCPILNIGLVASRALDNVKEFWGEGIGVLGEIIWRFGEILFFLKFSSNSYHGFRPNMSCYVNKKLHTWIVRLGGTGCTNYFILTQRILTITVFWSSSQFSLKPWRWFKSAQKTHILTYVVYLSKKSNILVHTTLVSITSSERCRLKGYL